MGKKSKKKGGASSKTSRKKKLAERREQQLFEADESSNQGHEHERPYFENDRVWFHHEDCWGDGSNSMMYRGIIKRVNNEGDGYVDVAPLQWLSDGSDKTVRIEHIRESSGKGQIIPDWCDMTLRFDVGDRVLCYVYGEWRPCVVSVVWPIGTLSSTSGRPPRSPTDDFPRYACSFQDEDGRCIIEKDDDDFIMEHPSVFRFSIGQKIVFNTKHARLPGAIMHKVRSQFPWLEGSITARDITGEAGYYTVYECKFKFGSKGDYFADIERDVDEHIASLSTDPRTRLLDSIVQDCERSHLSYLADAYEIDIDLFRDLAIRRAVDSASYNALTWLQMDRGIDVLSAKDEDGNSLLHQLATKPNVPKFFRKVGESLQQRGYCEEDCVDFVGKSCDKTWLDVLSKCNLKAFDIVLSLNSGAAICVMGYNFLDEDHEQRLRSLVSVDRVRTCIFERFLECRKYWRICSRMWYSVPSDKTYLSDLFSGDDASMIAKSVARFYVDWSHIGFIGRFDFTNLLRSCEQPRLVKLLYEADSRMFKCNVSFTSREDNSEFLQPQLANRDSRTDDLEVDILTSCTVGDDMDPLTSFFLGSRWKYDDLIRDYACQSTVVSLATYIQNKIELDKEKGEDEKKKSIFGSSHEDRLLKRRLQLISDEKCFPGRIEVFDFLWDKRPDLHAKLCILDAIVHRSGFIGHFVDRGILDLDAQASTYRQFKQKSAKMIFLDRGRIPPRLTTRVFLAYCSVQYDDLQSLEYLSTDDCLTTNIEGLNILQFACMQGRIEIAAYLGHKDSVFHVLASEPCGRKPFEGARAVHIAAKNAHTNLAEILLWLNSPELDMKKRGPEWWAKKSEHEHARDWALCREKPQALEKNTNRLLKLLESNASECQLKELIKCSKVFEEWREAGNVSTFDDQASFGLSLGEVLRKVCEHQSNNFALWLCGTLYFKRPYSGENRFWKEMGSDSENEKEPRLSRSDLLTIARENGFEDMKNCLSNPAMEDISVADPTMHHIFLAGLGHDLPRMRRICSHVTRVLAFCQIEALSTEAMQRLVLQDGLVDVFDELIRTRAIACDVMRQCSLVYLDDDDRSIVDVDVDYHTRPVNISLYVHQAYPKESPLGRLVLTNIRSFDRKSAYIILATEGYFDLLDYFLQNIEGWDSTAELNVCRIAAFFGHSTIIARFLDDTHHQFNSTLQDRQEQVVLGAAEALNPRDVMYCLDQFGPTILSSLSKADDYFVTVVTNAEAEEFADLSPPLTKSLLYAVLHNVCLDSDGSKQLVILGTLIEKFSFSDRIILAGLCFVLSCDLSDHYPSANVLNFIAAAVKHFQIDVVSNGEILRQSCKCIIDGHNYIERSDEDCVHLYLDWIKKMAERGVNIQALTASNSFGWRRSSIFAEYTALANEQIARWNRFDMIKNDSLLVSIQNAIESGEIHLSDRDRGGQLLTHVAAGYDRADVLEWLVTEKCMSLASLDGKSRNVLETAQAAKAVSASNWIKEYQSSRIIVNFLRRHHHKLLNAKRLDRRMQAATIVQRRCRGCLVRRRYSGAITSRMKDSQRFRYIWNKFICSSSKVSPTSWTQLREEHSDMNTNDFVFDESSFEDTDAQLSSALEKALLLDDTAGYVERDPTTDSSLDLSYPAHNNVDSSSTTAQSDPSWTSFQMTSHVVKFLKNGDPQYRRFLVRRLHQLATGESSRILKKRLKGCRTPIFETYLEQKSGFRILWTEEGSTKVIWFLSPHDRVSRLAKLIDDAKNRTARQLVPESVVAKLQNDQLIPPSHLREKVLLDVCGNTPLKLYDISHHNIQDIESTNWAPLLHLTDEEKDVVEAQGTVLLLGRSGTGKTVCICNKMECDRQHFQGDTTFKQLFVARSKRLTKYVQGVIGVQDSDQTQFRTFMELINELDATLQGSDDCFVPSQRIQFSRFKLEFFNSSSSNSTIVSPLVAWTVIRSLLKGSIEAFRSPHGVLPRESFTDVHVLGSKRCRVPAEVRNSVYDIFLAYEGYKKDRGLFDDCDRIRHLITRLGETKVSKPEVFERVSKSRVYVDEVQDYTQIELLLMFMVGSPVGMFLAGDPAQSVVEGTDLRFEEIRSVGHFVAGEQRRLVPNKYMTVTVNFRSHSGVLNCAGGFLDFLFHFFPSSAKALKKDYGLFQGSRPSVLHKLDAKMLKALLADKLMGAIVLVHDDSAVYWRRALDYSLVYGIREAKGLEFKTIILLDFFSELPASLQKPWRNIIFNRPGVDYEADYPLLSTYLKLLYTGITRCIERLFFVETKGSTAGDATVRFLTTNTVKRIGADAGKAGTLATRANATDVEALSMTADEFLTEGLNSAEAGELDEVEIGLAISALARAVWCFERAGNPKLASKARAHKISLEFRRGIEEFDNNHLETRAARIMESLKSEGLVREMNSVFYSVRPFLPQYTGEELEKHLTSRAYIPLV
mmetsp:Transcript_16444/g.38138  ORF Transcript_16444/g.38138 Transcript_16444/m.38138 type:complete len:2423 (+) Transcript_16444:381-7649(+)